MARGEGAFRVLDPLDVVKHILQKGELHLHELNTSGFSRWALVTTAPLGKQAKICLNRKRCLRIPFAIPPFEDEEKPEEDK